MTHIRHTEQIPGGQVSYPEFQPEPGEEENTQRMNGFYLALRDAASGYSSTLAGSRRYSAEYKIERKEDGSLCVEYTLRLRYRGHTEKAKTFCHRWQNGYLCPPQKQKRNTSVFFSRIRKLHKK
jgi:hypothetical protein